MKKQIAISVFFVFFLAQFGKQINFCLCSMAAYQHTRTLTCDCEKQLYAAVKTDNASKDQAPQHITASQPSDELFHVSNPPALSIHRIIRFTAWPKSGIEALYNQFGNRIFHPPPVVS